MDNQINAFANQKVKVTAKEFEAKYASKVEVYKFLTHDCGVYLCDYDSCTVWHMHDLCCGKRRRIQGKDVKHLHVPQYEGLAIKDMLEFGNNFDSVRESLPSVENEVLKMPRQYIANVIYTRLGAPFANWVEKRVNARHQKV